MARTLTELVGPIYEALDVVAAELIGAIPGVRMYASPERAAVGQKIRSPVSSARTAQDIVPGDNPPSGEPATGHRDLTITKARSVPITITGEQELGLGDTWMAMFADETAQAMRTLVNEVEADLTGSYVQASRAHGVAGTTPFVKGGNELADSAFIEKILNDNGAPGDRSLVVDGAAKVNLTKLTQLVDVSSAGDMGNFRLRGVIADQFGLAIRNSAAVAQHIAGSGSGYQIDNAGGYSVGDTVLHLDTGTGDIVAGDVITITDDASGAQYVVTTGAAGPGDIDITIAEPGLRSGVADNKAVTLAGDYRANLAFSRAALVLAARAPAVNADGDRAVDSMLITHPETNITFEIRTYQEYRRVTYDVGLAWGHSAIPRYMAILLG